MVHLVHAPRPTKAHVTFDWPSAWLPPYTSPLCAAPKSCWTDLDTAHTKAPAVPLCQAWLPPQMRSTAAWNRPVCSLRFAARWRADTLFPRPGPGTCCLAASRTGSPGQQHKGRLRSRTTTMVHTTGSNVRWQQRWQRLQAPRPCLNKIAVTVGKEDVVHMTSKSTLTLHTCSRDAYCQRPLSC